MSDNIPFDIQMEIIKWLPVKPLIKFVSVSKLWKSFIESSHFINGYGARHTKPPTRIVSFSYGYDHVQRYIGDYDMKYYIGQHDLDPSVVASPLLKQYRLTNFVGACHGLLCFYSYYIEKCSEKMLIIWNPFIGKSFGIALPSFYSQSRAYDRNPPGFGFGVCPDTRDPTVVKILSANKMHVEVFTLSSGIWNVIPSGNLPRQSIKLDTTTHVVIDRFIYWGAYEKISTDDDGKSTASHMVVSFDLITKEFKVIHLPETLTNELFSHVSVSKLKGSLVVSGYIKVEEARCCGVWVMDRASSFRKLFSIGAPVYKILGFRKNGEPIFETPKADGWASLDVYDPSSQKIKSLNLWSSGKTGSFLMVSYKESLLLLDHSDLQIYCDDN